MRLLAAVLGVAMILADGKDYTLRYVDNGDGGMEYRYVPTETAPPAIDPNDFGQLLAHIYGGGSTPDQAYQQYVANQATKGDGGFSIGQGVGGMVKDLAPIWAPAVGVGLGQAAGVLPGATSAPTSLADLAAGMTSGDAVTAAPASQFLGESAAAPGYGSAAGLDMSVTAPSLSGVDLGAYGTVGAAAAGGAAGAGGGGAGGAGGAGGSAAAGYGADAATNAAASTPYGPGIVNGVDLGAAGAAGVAAGAGGAAAGGVGGAAAGGAAGGGTAGALGRLTGTGQTGTDLASVLGTLGTTGLGIYGANQAADQFKALQDSADQRYQQNLALGAPYRSKLSDLMANPSGYLSSAEVTTPVQQGTDALARALSIHGNPAGNGGSLQALQDYATNQLYGKLGAKEDQLAGFGGLTQYNSAGAAGPNTSGAVGAIGANQSIYGDLGYGITQATDPNAGTSGSLAALLKQYQQKQSNPYALA